MTETVANATATVMEKAIGVVEQYDTDSVERPKQYGVVEEGEKEVAASNAKPANESEESKAEGSKESSVSLDDSIRRLKMVSGELLDLWLYEGSKGLQYLQESKAYKATDPYIDYLG